MVKRFKIKYIYETSDDSTTEDDIRRALNPKVNVFDTIHAITIDEV